MVLSWYLQDQVEPISRFIDYRMIIEWFKDFFNFKNDIFR